MAKSDSFRFRLACNKSYLYGRTMVHARKCVLEGTTGYVNIKCQQEGWKEHHHYLHQMQTHGNGYVIKKCNKTNFLNLF